jgi:hypothetical protein
VPTQYQAALLFVQCKVRTAAKRLTLGMRFAWFLVAFLASLDRWVAIFDASSDLVLIYASNFLGLVFVFYSVYRKRRAKDDKAPHTKLPRILVCQLELLSICALVFTSPWAMLRSRCQDLSRSLCA